MIRKSVITGTWLGLLLSLVLIYPAVIVFVRPLVPDMLNPLAPGGPLHVMRGLNWATLPALMGLAGLATIILLMMGSLSAMRAGVNSSRSGALCGGISGFFAAMVFYIFIVAPTLTIMAGANMLSFTLRPQITAYPMDVMVPFARFVLVGEMGYLALTVFAGGLLGTAEGALVGYIRRKHLPAPAPDSLMDCIESRSGYRAWFRNYEEPVLAGLGTGVVGGIILIMTDFWSRTVNLNTEDLGESANWLSGVVSEAFKGISVSGSHAQSTLLPIMMTVSFLVVMGMGGVAAFLPKNPPGFLRSRVFAAMVSGTMIGLLLSMPAISYLRFALMLLPQILLNGHITGSTEAAAVLTLLQTREMRILLIYLLPLPVIFTITLGYTIWGTLQGVLYSLLFAFLKIRPVDRARALRRTLREPGEQFLPRLYNLFQTECSAIPILEHAAFDMRSDLPRARLIAAYHTLATHPAHAARAFEQIAAVLESQNGWKLRSEILILHRSLAQGLQARTLAQIATLTPIPEGQTSTLPPQLAKAGDYISRTLVEVKKVERVDDLNSKIIFLSNALDATRQARIYCKTSALENFATPLPEIAPLRLMLDQWEGVILATVRDIQGSADLVAELKTRKLTRTPEMVISLALSNRGLNVAEKVRVKVDDCSTDFEIVEGGEQVVDILSPQETEEISLTIRPRQNAGGENGQHAAGASDDGASCDGPHCGPLCASQCGMRVCWSVSYGDALKSDYVLEFADQIEFVEVEKPFQRIFPIPYVTGTPLQSEQMFVGRQDVFAFVREHLLGTYQNNIIVLHGQRRTGKSSILYRLGSEMTETHVCVLIDMQGKAARGEVDFLYSIADDIVYTLENKGIQVELPPRSAFEESPEFFFRSRFLRSIYDALGDKNLLLMFDEFEELQKRVEDGKLTADIFPYLRNLMQHERRVDFIFAGTHKLEELGAEYWSILFNIAIYQKITFLALAEVTRLVTQPVKPYGMEYDPLAVERIYQVASGHPYFTQVVCHELVAYHNETRRSYVTVTDVEAALDRILERGEAHFKYIWAESTVEQRLTLMAMAEHLETQDDATLEDIAAVLDRRGRPITPDCLLEALANLESRDIVGRSGPRSSLYHFRVDLIRRWLYAARPSYEKVI